MIEIWYSKEEVIKITSLLPILFGLIIENIKQKIDNLKEIKLYYFNKTKKFNTKCWFNTCKI